MRPFFTRHRLRALWITGTMLALASTASSQEGLSADQIKARETKRREALKNRHTLDKDDADGIAHTIPVFPLKELSKELKVKAGAVSLLPDPKDHGDKRIAVYLLNATGKSLKNANSGELPCFMEVKDGDVWRSCQDTTIECGMGIEAPKDLAAGHGKLLLGWNPAVGDMTGELRYCVTLPHGRPIVSASFQGRYSSKELQQASPPGGFAGAAIAYALDGKGWKSPAFISAGITQSPEECLAAAELDRAYDESPLTKAALARWKATPPAGEEMAQCQAAVEKLLQEPWKGRTDAPALFRRGYAALARPRGKAGFGSPENCRALVWRYLGRVPGTIHSSYVNPARWDQLEAIRLSGNPWGVDRKLAAALVEEAVASLQSPDAAEREAAGFFLWGEWITRDYLADERWSFVIEQDASSARRSAISALARRGKGEQAGKWLANHLDLPEDELASMWRIPIEDPGKFAEWELAIASRLLQTSPLAAARPLSWRKSEIKDTGGKLPAELVDLLRGFLAKEAAQKRLIGLPPPKPGEPIYSDSRLSDPRNNQPPELGIALQLLADFNDPADTPLIRSYLEHPCTIYDDSSGRIGRRYELRSTAAKLLKERNEQVPEGIVFEEKIPTG